MNITNFKTPQSVLLAALMCFMPVMCGAQAYPSKPVRFIVGFPPGGTNDIVARALGQKLTELMGQQFVIENRGGANTAIASEMFVRMPPDGYTIMLNAPGHATNPSMMKLNFDSIRDFAFITVAAESQNLLVTHPSFPPRSVKELIAFSKARPGEINYGSSGVGTTVHLSAALFEYMTGVKWVHIPYKGAGPAATEVMAGQVSLVFGNPLGSLPHVKAGRLRAIAVSGPKRLAAMPEVPTVAASGLPGFDATFFLGLLGPLALPRDIVTRLNTETVKIVARREVQDALTLQGMEALSGTPEDFATRIKSEMEKTAKVVRESGMRLN